MLKLILGQFTEPQAEALQHALEYAQRYRQHIIMPYSGDPVQVIELAHHKRPWRRDVSIQAHKA